MFWGLIMEPKRRYMQEVTQSFHISMASLDVFASNDKPCQVLLNYDQRNYLLCTLQKDKIIQCPLDLNFEAGDVIAFATNGESNVHLTGYVIETDEPLEESSSEDEQDIQEKLEIEGKRKKKPSEPANNQPPKKKSKTEQLLDEVQEYDSNDDESFSLSKYLNEEEEQSEESGDSEASEESDQDEEAVVEEASSSDNDDDEDDDDGGEISSLSDDEEKEEVQIKMNGKQKKKKKVTEALENNLKASTGLKMKTDQQTPNKLKTPNKQDKTPKQDKKENKTPKQDKTPKENKTPKQKSEIATKSPGEQAQSPQKRTIEGGIIIQDIKVGDGPIAKSGKLLQVYYEGRLKHNNKLFDKLVQGQGFKFRLGKREVIKGWDVGVNGMKVGGKRRIVCPPAMAYGEKGSPPQIPPNSTLVFEVELKGVK
ncbi:hypothetical protein ILUMI_05283 [Ignelater luminosus]|uniref:FK506-binding protein n=1 Tax=Ignelater luminosus TaxID=2038154 RepID=A0A8K0D7J0_IGNLU|nr:hypothetical protein ILUMI_05283 [Ignelater luminosus]